MSEKDIYSYQPLWDNWVIDSIIGSGSFGEVYKIKKELFGSTLVSAVKYISISNEKNDQNIENELNKKIIEKSIEDKIDKIVNEINILYKLKGNINIIEYENYLVEKKDDGCDILIKMEYCNSLDKIKKQRKLSEQEIIKMGIDISNALIKCHEKGIIHKDIKEANIFMNDDGVFKLGDFGISTINNNSIRREGTLLFMSPEIIEGRKYDKSIDIYALGVLMYKMLNNERIPFLKCETQKINIQEIENAINIRTMGEKIPKLENINEQLSKIILSACNFESSKRPTAKEFKNKLEKIYKGKYKNQNKKISNKTIEFVSRNKGVSQDTLKNLIINEETIQLNDKKIKEVIRDNNRNRFLKYKYFGIGCFFIALICIGILILLKF